MKRPSWKIIIPTFLILISIVCVFAIIAFSKPEEEKHYQKGIIYAGLNRHSEAIKEFKKALEKKPNFLDAIYRLGQSYYAKKDYEKALEAYNRCIELNPNFLDALYQIGLLHLSKKEFDDLEKVSNKLKKLSSSSPKGQSLGPSLALDLSARMHLGKFKNLVSASTDLIKKEMPGPETRSAFRELGRGNLEKAIENINKLDKSGEGEHTKELIQQLTEAQKERDLAAANFEKALENAALAREGNGKPQKGGSNSIANVLSISTRLDLANIRLNQGKIDDVKKLCNKILKDLDANNRTARLYLSLAYAQGKNYEKAIPYLQEILSKNPNDPQAHLVLTELYFQTEKYDEALKEAKSVPTVYAKNPYLYYIKGLSYLSKDNYEQAIVELTEATKADPDFHEAHFHLARAFLATNRSTQAIRELQTTIRLQPDFIPAHLALADIRLREGWFDEAALEAKRVLETNKKNIMALRILSESLRRQGKYDEAGSYLENIVDSSLAPGKTPALPSPQQVGKNELRDHLSFMDVKLAAGEGDSLIAKYKSAVKANPQDLVSHNLLGIAYLKMGEVGKAINQFREMVKIDSSHVGARIGLAHAYAALGRTDLAIEQYKKALETNPEFLELHLGLGSLYQLRKRPDDALAEFNLVLKKDPQNVQAMIAMATIYANMGKDDPSKYDEAIKLVKKAQILNSNAVPTSLLLAAIYNRGKGDQKKATAELEKALEINPRFRPLYEVGLIYCYQNELDKAINIYKKAIEANPTFVDAYLNLAVVYQKKDAYKEAEEYCNKAIKLVAQNKTLHISMANILMSQGKFDEAKATIEKIKGYRSEYKNAYFRILDNYKKGGNTYKKIGAMINEGLIYQRHGWFKHAEEIYKEILKIEPDNLIAYSSLSDIYLRTNQKDEAISVCKKIINLNPNFTVAYTHLGYLYLERQEIAKAIANYKRATELDPNFWEAHLRLGHVYLQKNAVKEAIKEYETVISLSKGVKLPNEVVVAYNNLAWLLAEDKKDIKRAMSLAERAKALAPANGGVLDTLGYIYYLGGKDDKAVAELETAVLITPNEPTIRYHLGAAYEKKGEKEKALKEYKVALEISSKFPEAEKAKKAIARLKM